MKRAFTGEPLINHDCEGILIAAPTRLALNLFWSHISCCANHLLGALIARTLGNQSNAKITEQDLLVLTQQHVLRLNVAMNQLPLMCILQSLADLLDIGDDGRERQASPFRVTQA